MLQLNARVSAEDLQRDLAFIKADSKIDSRNRWLTELRSFAIWLVIAFIGVRYIRGAHISTADTWLFALSGLLFINAIIASVLWLKHGGMAAWLAKCSGEYTWQLNAEGISLRRKEASGFFAWSQIVALVESEDAWHFYLRRNLAVSIPKLATNQPQLVVNAANDYWRQHPDNTGLTLQTSLAAGLKQKSFWADLSTNLLNGLKLAFFAKVTALSFKVRTSQWLALIAMDILFIAFFDYCLSGNKPQFNLYGVSDYSLNYLLLLLAAIYICYLVAAKHWLAHLMVMILAASFAINLFYLPIRTVLMLQDGNNGAWTHWLVWGCSIVWLLAVVARALRLLFNYPWPTIGVLTAVYSFFVLALSGVFTQQQFFNKNYDDEYADYETNKIDVEATYYAQITLVEKALSAIKPERAGVADLYFVGFAGYGYQKVFSNEVKFAKKLLDEKHDTAGRSALLINHQDSINKTPLANAPNLGRTLAGVANSMNTDEDILFLFLSSHGSKDFKLSTDFYPFGSNDLPASQVKKLLDESGIKNRIIVVSACYSGGFIDVLKDENTLILTASSKDRNSFGCSNDAQYTYFGDAYFVQALKKERSFVKAFEVAKKLISAKEKKEQKNNPSSLPQIYIGNAIKPKLEAMLNKSDGLIQAK